jgi:chorismate synthase
VAAEDWAGYLDELRKSGNSVGAVIEIMATGVPVGLGAPVYGKLDTELAAAMMSINAVKGVEVGAGMGAATLTGVENADEIRMGPEGPVYSSNHAGGILGGISTGQPVVVRSCTARMPAMMTATPIRSAQPSASPSSSAAMATPKNGLRKWKVAARTAPIRCTSRNQTQVAASPGTSVV